MKYDCLIIDDERMLADSTAEYFNLFDVKTAIAYSVSDCRNFFNDNTAELLLLDINLGVVAVLTYVKNFVGIQKYQSYSSRHGQAMMIK